MDTMPIKFVVLCSIPEAIMIIYVGLYMMGIKPSVNKVIAAGILQGIASYFIRKHTGYGINILLQALTTLLLTCTIVKVTLINGFISSFIGISLNFIVEISYLIIALKVSNYTFAEILSRDWLRVVFTSPKQLILIIIIGVCIKYNITLEEEIQIVGKFNVK